MAVLVRRKVRIGGDGQRREGIGIVARPSLPDPGNAEEGDVGDEACRIERLAVALDAELVGEDEAGAFDPRGFGLEQRDLSDLGVARPEAPMRLDLAFFLAIPDHDPVPAFADTPQDVVEISLHRLAPSSGSGGSRASIRVRRPAP